MLHDRTSRKSEPAKVYPAPDRQDCWLVEAPARSPVPELVRSFSGSTAQRQAVQFAHEAFGGARVFIS